MSAEPRPVVEIRLPALPEHLPVVRATVGSAARLVGCSEPVSRAVVLAVNEACMNVIQHGYCCDPTGEIILQILNNGSHILFRLRDFAPVACPERVRPRSLEELRPGGLGTHFIREIMDEFAFRAAEDGTGNVWVMSKAIT